MGDAAAFAYISMADAIADAGLSPRAGVQSAHGRDRRLRRRLLRQPGGSGGPAARQGRAPGRPVHGHAHDVLDGVGQPRHRLQHPRPELFDLLGLRHVGALHRRGDGADPARQAGRGVRRWRRGTALEPERAVRRDGRAVVEVQRHARERLARLRRRPRWFRHRRRRRHGGGGVTRARAGPRRAHPRRDRRLRRHLRRRRHGRARPAKARCAACCRRWPRSTVRSITSTRTAPRRRSATSPNSARCAKCSATRCRRSRRPNRCRAIRSAPPACTRRSTAC